jgi:hypothetical protein
MRARCAVLVMLVFTALVSTLLAAEAPLADIVARPQPQPANADAFAVREPLPGQLGYLQAIRFIDDRMKYFDPRSAFFVSPAGELCFRTSPNHLHFIYEDYHSDWCVYPQVVSSVQAITNSITNINELVLWCAYAFPQCVREHGYPFFPGPRYSISDSVEVPTAAFRDQRVVLLNLIYLMGGNAVPDIP